MRPLHEPMSFDDFERLPRRVGWKYEYFDGMAHVTPRDCQAALVLDLAAIPDLADPPDLRPVERQRDAQALADGFVAAFANAPEYAGAPASEISVRAAEYLGGYFGDERGRAWPGSLLMQAGAVLVGAVLVKTRSRGPLLDCIFVRPEHARRGCATTLLRALVRGLRGEGHSRLASFVHLANEPSLAWHARCGFREIPDLLVAMHRAGLYAQEAHRGRRFGVLTAAEIENCERLASYWREQAAQLRLAQPFAAAAAASGSA